MARKTIEIRAKHKNGVTTVNALITHPMESAAHRDSETGELIHDHFNQEVTCEYKETVLLTAQWGTSISKDPYLSFSFKGGTKGERVKLNWVDNRGNSDTGETEIK